MKLLTREMCRTIPALYSNERNPDPTAVAKFFTPDSNWTWYVTEGATCQPEGCGWGAGCDHASLTTYDPAKHDVLFFGYVIGHDRELGYFRLSDLERLRGPLGLKVERDLYFTPCPLSEVS